MNRNTHHCDDMCWFYAVCTAVDTNLIKTKMSQQ